MDNANNSYPYNIIESSLENINAMNIILYDNDCGNAFFHEVVDKLRSDGINVSIAKTNDDVNCNGATIIALDEQYCSGPETAIFAPYNNTRVGFSDSLSIAMFIGFAQGGIKVKQIECGQRGLISPDGKGLDIGPTNTEKSISDGCDSSFVTISLGTEKPDAEKVALSIENGLMRQLLYLNSDDHQTDLIYRASSDDDLDNVSEYFGTTSSKLKEFNNIKGTSFTQSQTIINPYVSEMPAFNLENYFSISSEEKKHPTI